MHMKYKQTGRHTNGVRGWVSRIKGLSGVLGGVLLFALLQTPVQCLGITVPPGQSIGLTWSPNTNSSAAGYNVYYGTASQSYSGMVNVGNVTNATISGLVAGVTYYFSATTYDSQGGQSGFSNETSYTVPAAPAPTQMSSAMSAGQMILTVTGAAGSTHSIEASQDLVVWTVIGTVTVNDNGSFGFTDTNAANFPQRFYRISQ